MWAKLPTPITSPGGAGARGSCAASGAPQHASATMSTRRAVLEKWKPNSDPLNPNIPLSPSTRCSVRAPVRGAGRDAATYASTTSAKRASEKLRPIRLLVDVGRAGARELADQEPRYRVDAEQRAVLPTAFAIRRLDHGTDRLPFVGAHAPFEPAIRNDLDDVLGDQDIDQHAVALARIPDAKLGEHF